MGDRDIVRQAWSDADDAACAARQRETPRGHGVGSWDRVETTTAPPGATPVVSPALSGHGDMSVLPPPSNHNRRWRRFTAAATVFVLGLAGTFAYSCARILMAGGDTRAGMGPYIALVLTVFGGGAVLWLLWRKVLAAAEKERHPIPDVELPPQPHLGLSGEVAPPRRW